MARLIVGRCGAFGIAFIAASTANARAETVVLPTFDVVATTPLQGGEIDVAKISRRRLADRRAGHPDLQRYDDHPDAGASGAGRHRRQRLGQRLPARRQLSRLRRDAGHRHADRPRRLPERRSHQRGVRRHGQLGPHSRECDRQDDDRRGRPDLWPQCARRRPQCDDEERLHLAGLRSRSSRRLILSRAGGVSVRQADRRLVGLYGGHTDQRRRLAHRRSVATHQLLRRRRLQGERVRVAPATHRGEHPVRRRCFHADPGTAERLEQRLHRSPDDL